MFNFARIRKHFLISSRNPHKTLFPGPKRLKKCWSVISLPLKVIVLCAITMGVGTAVGRWRIVKTMQLRLTKLNRATDLRLKPQQLLP